MGSKPKAPPAAPDPLIAAERARREAIAIGQADQRRTARFGSDSTIRSNDPNAPRPDQDMAQVDIADTAASRNEKLLKSLEAGRANARAQDYRAMMGSEDGMTPNDANNEANLNKSIEAAKKAISPADKAAHQALVKDNNIANYINTTRKRIGVASTKGAK